MSSHAMPPYSTKKPEVLAEKPCRQAGDGDTIDAPGESHDKGKGLRSRGYVGVRRRRR